MRSVVRDSMETASGKLQGVGVGGEVVVGGGGVASGGRGEGGGGWVDQEFKNQGLLREQEKSKEFTLLTGHNGRHNVGNTVLDLFEN